MSPEFDLVIVGSGPSGLATAIEAAFAEQGMELLSREGRSLGIAGRYELVLRKPTGRGEPSREATSGVSALEYATAPTTTRLLALRSTFPASSVTSTR